MISNTRKCISSDIQTSRSRLKKLGCFSFFQPTSQCLDMCHETHRLVFDILLNEQYLRKALTDS